MSARKPTSVFVIAQTPGLVAGLQLQVERIPVSDGQQVEQVVRERYASHATGTELYVVEDTKVSGYTVQGKVELVPMDDTRLPAGDPGAGPHDTHA